MLAIDLNTGKRLWETPADDPLDEASEHSRATLGQPAQIVQLACQRAWTDGIYGALSSDGRLVFSIEGLSFANVSPYVQQIIIRNGRRVLSRAAMKPSNRLAAHEIAGGKRVWEIGGESIEVAAKKAEDGGRRPKRATRPDKGRRREGPGGRSGSPERNGRRTRTRTPTTPRPRRTRSSSARRCR